MDSPIIYWFRQDLRLDDLPGLQAAASTGRPLLAVYILDDDSPGSWSLGGASRWWLHHSLQALSTDIESRGGRLHFAQGDPQTVLSKLAADTGASHVFCSRQYEPWARELEEQLHTTLDERGVTLQRFSGSMLWEPETVQNQQGAPYKVFTPFWRRCRALPHSVVPAGACAVDNWHTDVVSPGSLDNLQLLPKHPNWAQGWSSRWQPGERNATVRLQEFLQTTLENYDLGRDHPATDSTSLLSPHLHFGEISPARVYTTALEQISGSPELADAGTKFLSELGWREFSYYLLFHFPHFPEQPFNPKFERFPWVGGKEMLLAWQRGATGYPLVDAGMRELWQTGYMHNRVRMVVASFLCKHLLVDWRSGERWFWDTLLDADLASNSCSWQWVAGSGADASPYYRVFNPVTQSKKFDGSGQYIKRWVPELAQLPDRNIHEPWLAPQEMLAACNVELGETYPHPIVEHKAAREAALLAYEQVRG